jgi:hypothetical protein
MNAFRNNPFHESLEIVTTLRDRQIQASLTEMRCADDLSQAMRELAEAGIDIGALSEASGLPVEQVRQRIERDLLLG